MFNKKERYTRISAIVLVVLMTITTLLPAYVTPEISYGIEKVVTPGITRVSGQDRYDTAIKVAAALKEELGIKKFDSIIVATGGDFADALSGSSLAADKSAPILLINKSGSNSQVFTFIRKNLTAGGTIYILGGARAVPAAIATQLKSYGKVVRRYGDDRYATNLSILEELDVTEKDLLICSGKNYPDAIAASATGSPILLVGDTLTQDQKQFLSQNAKKAKRVFIIGGAFAVSDKVETQISKYCSPTRIAGKNRYATAIRIRRALAKASQEVVLATGTNFPDGLTGGVLAYAKNAPLLLSANSSDFFPAYKEIIERGNYRAATIIGGKAVVSDDATGMTAKGKQKLGLLKIGTRYYFSKYANQTCDLLKNAFKTVNDKRYYFTAKTGVAAKNEMFQVKGKYYGAGSDSTLAKEGWNKAGKLTYYFKNYEVHEVCIMAKTVLDKNGHTLRAAYNYAKALPPTNFANSPYWGILWFAKYGFTKNKGDCNAKGAVVYIMAKMLGYDVTQVKGKAYWLYGGSRTPVAHSWLYVKYSDGTWICDPNKWDDFKVKNGKGAYRYMPEYIVMPLEPKSN